MPRHPAPPGSPRDLSHDGSGPARRTGPRQLGEVDEAALTAALDEFAATLAGSFSVQEILAQLAGAAVRILDVDGAGTMVAAQGRLLRFAYASGPRRDRVSDLETLQETTRTGPCADVFASGELLDSPDLSAEGAWPEYQVRAVDLGLPAVTAVPLAARGQGWGVLDLYRATRRRLSPRELDAARTLANLATSCLVVTADRASAEAARTELARRAMHDPLTELPVRWVLLEQLGHALTRLARHPGQLAVLFLDLDGLKYVNDTYGHATGDELLLTCAHRVRAALRPSDLVARVGGDEFVVVLEDFTGATDATDVAQRILTSLAAPHRLDGRAVQPSASIGVAVTDDPDRTAEALIAHADSAMYQAKRGGRGRVAVVDAVGYEAHRAEATDTASLLPALRAALASDQLELHYQPVVELGSRVGAVPRDAAAADLLRPPLPGRVHAVEALLRWHRPGHGLVPAADFIELAERTGVVVDLRAWALRTACRQLVAWDEVLGPRSPRQLFVDVAAAELVRQDLAGRTRAVLAETGVDPDRVTLEVTEGGLLSDQGAAAETVAALLDLGCHLPIDDFGTGWSSLSRLVELPARTLKVDRAFARDLVSSAAARAVVTAVLGLGASLDRVVVVKGIEDQATLEALQELGATHAQGYHLAAPQTAEQLAELLAAQP